MKKNQVKQSKVINDFQLEILKKVNSKNIGRNILVSPLSIYHILSLATNGAAKNTLTEMLKTLSHNNLNEMNNDNKKISSCIRKYKSVEMANGAFIKFTPEYSFLQMVKMYKAEIESLKDAAQINAWCSKATHNKINNIIGSIENLDLMVLINAVYFKGFWEKSFDKKKQKKKILKIIMVYQ